MGHPVAILMQVPRRLFSRNRSVWLGNISDTASVMAKQKKEFKKFLTMDIKFGQTDRQTYS